jgi:hypothetical protein
MFGAEINAESALSQELTYQSPGDNSNEAGFAPLYLLAPNSFACVRAHC